MARVTRSHAKIMRLNDMLLAARSSVASKPEPSVLAGHGASRLAEVDVDAYNAELSDEDGFVGDRASGRAFRELLEASRDQLRHVDNDPIGTVQPPYRKSRVTRRLASCTTMPWSKA